ncbi:MAG TPA: ABC transporter substrate-binding protein [Bdellovibrionota bacterium]|nr:ABC transporter substrate-binding protein [Bdellovibrionota bacterium]
MNLPAKWILAFSFTVTVLSGGFAAQPPVPSSPAAVPAPAQPKSAPASAPVSTPVSTIDTSVDSPTAVIQKYTDELKSLVDLSVPKEQRKLDGKKEQKIAEKVRQFFDFQSLARMSLGHHWMRITEAQRKEFSELFIALVEDSYLRRTRDLIGDYQITYGSEEIKGNRAKVRSKVARRDADIEIVYELHRNPKNWMIFNIILDDVDLIKNYRSQFNSVIGKSSFAKLLDKMRKKLDQEEDVNL